MLSCCRTGRGRLQESLLQDPTHNQGTLQSQLAPRLAHQQRLQELQEWAGSSLKCLQVCLYWRWLARPVGLAAVHQAGWGACPAAQQAAHDAPAARGKWQVQRKEFIVKQLQCKNVNPCVALGCNCTLQGHSTVHTIHP